MPHPARHRTFGTTAPHSFREAVLPSVSRPSASRTTASLRTYFAALPPDARRRIKQLRALIRAAAPGADEAFSYRIPAYRAEGRMLVWYAAWKAHVSLYPITASIRRAHAAALKPYAMSKGTVRFPLSEPLPAALVQRLVKARLAEVKQSARK